MIDFRVVGAIQQDFRNMKIRILSKQNYVLHEYSYTNKVLFESDFEEIGELFSLEIESRKLQLIKK